MAAKFNFELVSPEEKLVSEPAFQVTIPGEEGDLGVRAGHMSLVVAIRPGIVEVLRDANGTSEKIFIAGGFADISQDHCTVLAEEAFPVVNLNADKLTQELASLEDELKLAHSEGEKSRLQSRREVVQTMLSAIAV